MPDFHRLTTPTYIGGLPGTHGYINNTPGGGAQAPADNAKSGGHIQDGTYFIAFGEDALSAHGNRAHKALAANTDWLDDIVSGGLPVPSELDVTAPGGAVSSKQITGLVFVGIQGTYSNTQAWRDRLVELVDSTGSEVVDPTTGSKVQISEIRDSGGAGNIVGGEATGFHTNPIVYFSPSIPAGVNYRLSYGVKGSLKAAVKDKTYLDAFTRWGIPSSNQVPAEVERFLHQTSRRTGDNVTALKGTIVETPGTDSLYGLSKSSSLTLDVDPTGDAGAVARSLALRVGRDGTPISLFTLAEETFGGTSAKMVTALANLKLADSRMVAANGLMPLSDATHDRQRLWEADSEAQPSLLSMHNTSRWMATLGDGTNTFGDFSDLSTAIAWFVANAPSQVKTLLLFVKAGTYSEATGITLPSDKIIHIIGEGVSGVTFANGSAGTLLTIPATSTLIIEGVSFTKSSTGTLAVAVNGKLRMCRCSLTSQYLNVSGTAVSQKAYVEDTVIDMSALSTGTLPCVSFSSGSGVCRGIVLKNCTFNTAEDGPGVQLLGSAGTYQDILFDKCYFYVDTVASSAGNPGGKNGVLYLTPTGTGLTASVEFRDCDVYTVSGIGTNIMMYCRQASTNYITIKTLKISGGRWEQGSSDITPFYMGGYTYSDDPHIGELIIENLTLTSSQTSMDYGAMASELSNSGYQAGYFLGARDITIRNLRFDRWFPRARAGTLYIRTHSTGTLGVGGDLDVNGIYFGEAKLGTDYGNDDYQVYVAGGGVGSSRKSSFRNLSIKWNASTVSYVDKGALGLNCPGIVVEDCYIYGFNYTYDPAVYLAGTGTVTSTAKFINCMFSGNGIGILGSGAVEGEIISLEVSDCYFSATNYGISLTVAQASGYKTNCVLRNNTFNFAGAINPVLIAPDDEDTIIHITGNRFYGGDSKRIQLGKNYVASGGSLGGMIDNNDLDGGYVHIVGGGVTGSAPNILGLAGKWDISSGTTFDWTDAQVNELSTYMFNNRGCYSREIYVP